MQLTSAEKQWADRQAGVGEQSNAGQV